MPPSHTAIAQLKQVLPKLPIDAMILAPLLTLGVTGLGFMTYRTLKYDPEQSTARYYEDENAPQLAQDLRAHHSWNMMFNTNIPGISQIQRPAPRMEE